MYVQPGHPSQIKKFVKKGFLEFTSYGGITLSRGWLCIKWKVLDIPGTQLHLAMQLWIVY